MPFLEPQLVLVAPEQLSNLYNIMTSKKKLEVDSRT
jgi:hypothetical protein